MTRWLTEEWFEQARALAASANGLAGPSARIQHEVTGGSDGEVRYFWVLEDGVPVGGAVGSVEDPDVTITMGWADAVAVQRGTLDPNVAFMQGRLKVAGSMGVMMNLLAGANAPDLRVMRQSIVDGTEF